MLKKLIKNLTRGGLNSGVVDCSGSKSLRVGYVITCSNGMGNLRRVVLLQQTRRDVFRMTVVLFNWRSPAEMVSLCQGNKVRIEERLEGTRDDVLRVLLGPHRYRSGEFDSCFQFSHILELLAVMCNENGQVDSLIHKSARAT